MTRRAPALLGAAALALTLLTPTTPARADVYELTQDADITITGTGPVNASPYPSTIARAGLGTVVTDVDVRILVSHGYVGDLDVVLVGPDQRSIVLMSDVCNSADNVVRAFSVDDEAATAFPSSATCSGDAYRPTNLDSGFGDEVFPTVPTMTTLAGFDGSNPNGEWQLYVRDDTAGDTGAIREWSLSIETAATPYAAVPGFGTEADGPATRYPIEVPVTGRTGRVTDVDVVLPSVTHSWPADLDVLLVGPSGASTVLSSDACGFDDVLEVGWTFDDEAPAPLPSEACGAGRFRPTDLGSSADPFPAPAPAGPFGSTLSVFDGTAPNGTWTLYVVDDGPNPDGAGWLGAAPQLRVTTTDVVPPATTITARPRSGKARTATIRFRSSEAGTFRCKVDAAA